MVLKIKAWLEKHRFINYWIPVIMICALIYFLSSRSHLPDLNIMQLPEFDKLEHGSIYAALGFFIRRAFLRTFKNDFIQKWAGPIAIILCFLYGISDEYHQSFVPNRDCDIFDALADCCGGFIGQWVYSLGFLTRWTDSIL